MLQNVYFGTMDTPPYNTFLSSANSNASSGSHATASAAQFLQQQLDQHHQRQQIEKHLQQQQQQQQQLRLQQLSRQTREQQPHSNLNALAEYSAAPLSATNASSALSTPSLELPSTRSIQSMFISDNLRQELLQRRIMLHAKLDPDGGLLTSTVQRIAKKRFDNERREHTHKLAYAFRPHTHSQILKNTDAQYTHKDQTHTYTHTQRERERESERAWEMREERREER